MITYNDIYEAARKERYSKELQKLSRSFIVDVSKYLKDKKEISLKEDDVFSDVVIKTKKQIENAVTLFKELMLRRKKKILDLVLIATETGISKKDFVNMLVFEKELFESLMKCVDLAEKKLSETMNGKELIEQKNVLVVFKKDIEEFVDLEGEKMGPYNEGEIANIPKEVSKILVEDEKAEVMEE